MQPTTLHPEEAAAFTAASAVPLIPLLRLFVQSPWVARRICTTAQFFPIGSALLRKSNRLILYAISKPLPAAGETGVLTVASNRLGP
jgi:hypothetical protein